MRATLVLSSLALLAACSPNPSNLTANGPGGVVGGSPTVTGTITQVTPVTPPGEVQGTILIEEQPGQPNGGRKIVFKILATTSILRRNGGADQRIYFNELRVGQSAQGWAAGAIAESYPEQATASTILVTGGP